MSTLQGAIENVQAVWQGLEGIKDAPDAPPEDISVFPFAISYAARTRVMPEAGWMKGVHTIVSELHVSRQILPAGVRTAMSYLELFLAALFADVTLGGMVDTIVGEVRGEFGFLSWGSKQNAHVGWRFEFEVKQQSSLEED